MSRIHRAEEHPTGVHTVRALVAARREQRPRHVRRLDAADVEEYAAQTILVLAAIALALLVWGLT